MTADLQLWVAKARAIKIKTIENPKVQRVDLLMEHFRELIAKNYLTLHKPSDYASLLHVTTNTLTKHSAIYFKKPPSCLINERLRQEAKKQQHLTSQSIKEIAHNLAFDDEFYFTKVFKKFTTVSPKHFGSRRVFLL